MTENIDVIKIDGTKYKTQQQINSRYYYLKNREKTLNKYKEKYHQNNPTSKKYNKEPLSDDQIRERNKAYAKSHRDKKKKQCEELGVPLMSPEKKEANRIRQREYARIQREALARERERLGIPFDLRKKTRNYIIVDKID
jgi:hypothetical protein